ncbi:hypothetical protein C882_0994 [Caenispirillum salinarum AK4]|uniref:Uncharacterized protein n=1 Tax=Caenispirillum salinarum AK4 TaxID=1238182 RepID=K9GR10_9PROT|nr:cbb3-type cytochrome c oxidase subunit I [Caenispirillum salinarum]EKV28420.1 hypothetical protein C882_0994 [Caenispirillum salinarum AK4]
MTRTSAAVSAAAPETDDTAGGLRRELHGWAGLSVAALAVAGLFVLLIVPARTPVVQDLLPWDPNVFFRQALVTHVVFSVVIWFLGGLGLLCVMATERLAEARLGGRVRARALGPAGLWLTVLSMLMLVAGTLAGAGRPSLNNYVPVLVHPLYYAGLAVLFAGVALPVVRLLVNLGARLKSEPDRLPWAVAAVGATYLMAPVCFLLAWEDLPPGLSPEVFNEQLFWGGGHVLQVVNTGVLMAAWHVVMRQTLDAPLLPRPLFLPVFLALPAVGLAGVVTLAATDAMSGIYYRAFTDLYLYALVAPAALGSLAVANALWRRRGGIDWKAPGVLGLLLSLILFAVGGLLGYGLGEGDTRTPAHYHAVIGGVNLSLMALFAVCVLPALGRGFARARPVRWFLGLYFTGQLVHSLGLYAAGTMGVARKAAGAEQGLDSALKIASMGIMGAGGLVAVIGGVMFVWMAGRRLWPAGRMRRLANT